MREAPEGTPIYVVHPSTFTFRQNSVGAPWFHRRARSLRDRGASSHRIDVVVMTAVSFNNVFLIEGDGGVSEKKSRELPPPQRGGSGL